MSIYLDNAATTALRPAALLALTKQLQEIGNPSSLHTFGRDARRALEDAREKIAKFVGAKSNEIILKQSELQPVPLQGENNNESHAMI